MVCYCLLSPGAQCTERHLGVPWGDHRAGEFAGQGGVSGDEEEEGEELSSSCEEEGEED